MSMTIIIMIPNDMSLMLYAYHVQYIGCMDLCCYVCWLGKQQDSVLLVIEVKLSWMLVSVVLRGVSDGYVSHRTTEVSFLGSLRRAYLVID